MMKLEKGSKLAREESREKRKIRSSALQDLLDEQIEERQAIMQRKKELFERKEKKERDRQEKFQKGIDAERRANLRKVERQRKRHDNKISSAQAEDIAQAKHKAAKIREQGMKEYKQQLLKELELDLLLIEILNEEPHQN